MNEEINQPIPLPDPSDEPVTYTFDAPSILLGMEENGSGLITTTVRHGKTLQMEGKMVVEHLEVIPADEAVLRIQSLNTVNVGQAKVSVLNDVVELPSVKLPATIPTVSEYLALQGQEVAIYRNVRRSHPHETKAAGREYFVLERLFITLP